MLGCSNRAGPLHAAYSLRRRNPAVIRYHRRTRRPWSGLTREGLLDRAAQPLPARDLLYGLCKSCAVVGAPRFNRLNDTTTEGIMPFRTKSHNHAWPSSTDRIE